MPLDKKKLEGLRRTVRRHLNWLVREIAGEDALTEEEKKDLVGFKPLPKQASDFIQRSFILGRLKSILKKKEYKDITLSKLDQAIKDADLTPLEKMALDEARRSAGNYIKNLTADIEAGIFQRLSEAEGQIVTEATIRNIIREETAFAVLEEKTWKELASTLSDSLKVEYSKRLEMIARTELHSAKQKGIAQAIANKADIYGSSDGPDSNVSVVTQTGRCEDCARLYEDKDGNPKVFKLAYLLGNGSNANRNHKKVNKQHIHWVAVVPPSHPHCFCELVYVPPGYIWKDRRLVLDDKDKLVKAIGDSTLSAKRTPKGPPQKGPTPPPQPGNIPGAAAPGKMSTAATVKPPSAATATPSKPQAGGSGIEYEYWKGTGAPPSDGNWEAYQKRDGGNGYRRPLGSGGHGASPEESSEERGQKIQQAKEWGSQGHPDAVKLNHISEGKVIDIVELGEDEENTNKGVTESHRGVIEGNGRVLIKPIAFSGEHRIAERYAQGNIRTEGAQSVPLGTQHKREAAAYSAHMMFGLKDFVPPTVTRHFNGKQNSFQSWEEGFQPLQSSCLKEEGLMRKKMIQAMNSPEGSSKSFKNQLHALIEIAPEDKREKFVQKLNDGAVMALVLNHNDQHLDNVLVNDDFDVRFIDNSVTAANGMEGAKVQILREFHNMGRKVKVSDTMMARFGNTSLGDLQRSLGGQLEDWAVGQTFLRMKYISYLQETEGHIDYEKFKATIGSGSSLSENEPRNGFWQDYKDVDGVGTSEEFNRRKNAGLLQNQLFESFSKQWIQDSLNLPEGHPDRIAAKQLDEIGVFMGPGFTLKEKEYRDRGLHRRYEKTIKPGYPPKDIKTANGVEGLSKKEESNINKNPSSVIKTPEAKPLSEGVSPASRPSDTMELSSKDLEPSKEDSTGADSPRAKKKMLTPEPGPAPDSTGADSPRARRRKMEKSMRLFVRLDR